MTNRVLLEARVPANSRVQSNQLPTDEATIPLMISVTEQSTGLRLPGRSNSSGAAGALLQLPRVACRTSPAPTPSRSASTHRSGQVGLRTPFDFQPLSYRFNNGVPNQHHAARAAGGSSKATIDHDVGVFAQDRWTERPADPHLRAAVRLLRQQLLRGAHRARHAGADPGLHRSRSQDNLSWKDITPRLGGGL